MNHRHSLWGQCSLAAEKDLPKIKKEMQRIIRRNLPLTREEVRAAWLWLAGWFGGWLAGWAGGVLARSWAAPAPIPIPDPTASRPPSLLALPHRPSQVSPEEARARIEASVEPYKLEILEDILSRDKDASITIYHIGQPGDKDHWWDLCAGPHVPSTGAISPDAVDLETVAGGQGSASGPRCCEQGQVETDGACPALPCPPPALHHPPPTPPTHCPSRSRACPPTPSLCPMQVPTGAATKRGPCCSASTAPPGRPPRSWQPTSGSRRRRRGVTTGGWALSWTCSPYPMRRAAAWCSGTPRAPWWDPGAGL